MTDLIAPVIIKRNARRYRQLDLDQGDFVRGERLLSSALSRTPMLSRNQIGELFEGHGLSADGQRLPYLLQRASLDGVLCHGPEAGREATFVLRDTVAAPSVSANSRSTSVRRLAQRYFAGHSPASKIDFGWWSGLPAAEVTVAVAELTNEQVLRSATSEAASGLGIAGQAGRLVGGFDADVLVVDGDPLQSIDALGRPVAVWARGVSVR